MARPVSVIQGSKVEIYLLKSITKALLQIPQKIVDKPAQPILYLFPRKHGQVPKTLTDFQDGIKLKQEDGLFPNVCKPKTGQEPLLD